VFLFLEHDEDGSAVWLVIIHHKDSLGCSPQGSHPHLQERL